MHEESPQAEALLRHIEAQIAAITALQARPRWRRFLSAKRELAMVEETDRLLNELYALTGRVRQRPAPPPTMRGLRGPLFWWWMQQGIGVWQMVSLLNALDQGRPWLALFHLLLLWVTIQWPVPPYRQAKSGQWRR